MDATPIDRGQARPVRARPAAVRPRSRHPDALAIKWTALHEAAGTAARIGGIEPPALPPRARDLPLLARQAPAGQLALIEHGIADLAAILEPGIAALLRAHGAGVVAHGAARALWREFEAARDAVVALLPQAGMVLRLA